MVQALTEALRGLTLALREFRAADNWELVDREAAEAFGEASVELAVATRLVDRPRSEGAGQSSAVRGGSVAATPVVSTAAPASSFTADWRHYVILSNPGTGKIGYIAGPGDTTWGVVENSLRGGRLSGSGARLRRVEDRNQALAVWEMAFPGRAMPEFPRQ